MAKPTKKKRKHPSAAGTTAPGSDEPAGTPSLEPRADRSAEGDDVVDATFDEPDEGAAAPEGEASAPAAGEELAPADSAAAAAAAEDEAPAATQLGAGRWVAIGFFLLWLVSAYVLGQALAGLWNWAAVRVPALATIEPEGELISRKTLSLAAGGLLAGLLVIYYARKASVRSWADEVAEEVGKVTWPTRKETANNTVVVLAVSAVITLYLTVLDRLFGFVTNLIYSTGA